MVYVHKLFTSFKNGLSCWFYPLWNFSFEPCKLVLCEKVMKFWNRPKSFVFYENLSMQVIMSRNLKRSHPIYIPFKPLNVRISTLIRVFETVISICMPVPGSILNVTISFFHTQKNYCCEPFKTSRFIFSKLSDPIETA